MPTIVTQAEFARRLKERMGRVVARSTVKRWADDGKLVMAGKKVNLEASLARIESLSIGQIRTDVAERHREESAQKTAQAPLSAPESRERHQSKPQVQSSASHEPTGGQGSEDRTRYKRMARYYQNQSIKVGMALSRGQTYWMKDVGAEGLGLGNALRAGIERLIDETAPSLAAITDARQRQGLLGRETKKLARLLAREYPKALRRLRQGARITKASA
jgi:hypothetical protein